MAFGLPWARREHGHSDDILAGRDFLSIIMESSALGRPYHETTTEQKNLLQSTLPVYVNMDKDLAETYTPVVRETRSTRLTYQRSPTKKSNAQTVSPASSNSTKQDPNYLSTSVFDVNVKRIIGVSVSSSVEEAPGYSIPVYISKSTSVATTIEPSSYDDVRLVEEHPSLVADVNKSEFTVDEIEPITSNGDDSQALYSDALPANVEALPAIKKLADFEKSSKILRELSQENLKDKLQPYHHTVIYHDNSQDPTMARSVSYSSVIRPISDLNKRWMQEEVEISTNPSAENHNFLVSRNHHDYNESLEKTNAGHDWTKGETSTKHYESTEMNWATSEKDYGVQQKPYGENEARSMGIYGQPEENYEVDEAVSVQTNGRAYGVQDSRLRDDHNVQEKSQQKDKNQKVGYVLDGRKERRYRVEERTSDGFIVGEYGVVNHDDGLLRGVRYTADGTISPRLIYDTLMKFLSL